MTTQTPTRDGQGPPSLADAAERAQVSRETIYVGGQARRTPAAHGFGGVGLVEVDPHSLDLAVTERGVAVRGDPEKLAICELFTDRETRKLRILRPARRWKEGNRKRTACYGLAVH